MFSKNRNKRVKKTIKGKFVKVYRPTICLQFVQRGNYKYTAGLSFGQDEIYLLDKKEAQLIVERELGSVEHRSTQYEKFTVSDRLTISSFDSNFLTSVHGYIETVDYFYVDDQDDHKVSYFERCKHPSGKRRYYIKVPEELRSLIKSGDFEFEDIGIEIWDNA